MTINIPDIVSIFHWPGSKQQLAPILGRWVLEHPQCEVYCEPFLGGGKVMQWLLLRGAHNRIKLVGGDVDPNVYAVYAAIQQYPDLLWQSILDALPSNPESRPLEYWHATKRMWLAQLQTEMPVWQRAAITLLLNRVSYAGMIYRGGCNTTHAINNLSPPYLRKIINWHNLLAHASFLCADWQETIQTINESAVCLYLDPPYYGNTNNVVYGPYHTAFDHHRLWRYLKDCPYPYVLSYDDHLDIREAFKHEYIHEVAVTYYMISHKPQNMRRSELLITNCPRFYQQLQSKQLALKLPTQ